MLKWNDVKNDLFNVMIIFVIFVSVDVAYLSIMSSHFKGLVKRVQKSELVMDLVSTVLVYIVMVIPLYIIVFKLHHNRDVREKSLLAALLGFTVYATYELTNKALFKDWDWTSVAIDTTWGVILYTFVTYNAYTTFISFNTY